MFRFLAAIPLLAVGANTAFSDCGSVPYNAPLRLSPLSGGSGFEMTSLPDGSTRVDFDASEVVVYEPGQRAIILWDGREEILLLATEIRTNQPVSILEVIPMPSMPVVTPGEFETFEKFQALRIEKQMWTVTGGGGLDDSKMRSKAATIRFNKLMGAHDITVAQVLDASSFSDWVMEYLDKQNAINPEIDPRFLEIIQNYLDRGFTYFVFDSIDASDEVQSRQPIQYRFESNSVFYPLEISTLESGKTTVDLLLVTRDRLTEFPQWRPRIRLDKPFGITQRELADVHEGWAEFMGRECYVQPVQIKGKLEDMTADFVAR